VRQLAGALFDEVVTPLAQARRTAEEPPYFPTAAEPQAHSYYGTPLLSVMREIDFEFPGGGNPEGLIDALAAYWTAQSETALAAMAPRLKEIANAVTAEAAEGDGTISILCYTMF
jgi:hypothetical protein